MPSITASVYGSVNGREMAVSSTVLAWAEEGSGPRRQCRLDPA
ncbi:hypothetical protein [Candidatus Methylacidiphilum infernorum]|nr:hypothetical protein [Candidatus Methylacidiphilum infernorum]